MNETTRAAVEMAHLELVRLGNALNWEEPITQATADAVNALRWIKGEADWPPDTLTPWAIVTW